MIEVVVCHVIKQAALCRRLLLLLVMLGVPTRLIKNDVMRFEATPYEVGQWDWKSTLAQREGDSPSMHGDSTTTVLGFRDVGC